VKQTDKEWAAKLLRWVVVKAVEREESNAKLLVPMARQEAAAQLRTAAEVRLRLGLK